MKWWAASSGYLRLLIFLPAILIPACESVNPTFCMMYSVYKLNKQGDNIQPWWEEGIWHVIPHSFWMLFYKLRWLRSLTGWNTFVWDSCWDDIVLKGPCGVWKGSKIGFIFCNLSLHFKFCIGQFLPLLLSIGLSCSYLLIMLHIWHYGSGKRSLSILFMGLYKT